MRLKAGDIHNRAKRRLWALSVDTAIDHLPTMAPPTFVGDINGRGTWFATAITKVWRLDMLQQRGGDLIFYLSPLYHEASTGNVSEFSLTNCTTGVRLGNVLLHRFRASGKDHGSGAED